MKRYPSTGPVNPVFTFAPRPTGRGMGGFVNVGGIHRYAGGMPERQVAPQWPRASIAAGEGCGR